MSLAECAALFYDEIPGFFGVLDARENREFAGFAGASVRIPKPAPPVDNAEHLARIVELLDWLKKAKAQELREAAKRAGP